MKDILHITLTAKIHRDRDLSASLGCPVTFFGLALTQASVAARQHFAAIKYATRARSYARTSKRLWKSNGDCYAREEAFSPARLEPAARG